MRWLAPFVLRLHPWKLASGRISAPRWTAPAVVGAGAVCILSLTFFHQQHSAKADRSEQAAEVIAPSAAPVLPAPQPEVVAAPLIGHVSRAMVPRPYPMAYGILLSRSIFAIGGKAAPAPALAGRYLSGDASALALKGITQEDSQFTAYITDVVGGRILALHVGDAIGSGRICDITLHDVGYQSGTTVTRIEVGQGLASNAEGPK